MNNTMKSIVAGFVAALSVASLPAAAQKSIVKYEILYDNPLAFKKLFVNLTLLNLELGSPTAYRPGINGEFLLNRHLYFFGGYDRTVFSFSDKALNNQQSHVEAGGIFSFTSKVREHTAKIDSRGGGYHYRYKLKAKVHRQLGVHGGIDMFNTYKQDGDYYAYSNTSAIFAGIATTSTHDLLVKFPDKTLNRASRAIWYVDVMMAPSIKYTDATDYASYAGSASTAAPATFPAFTKVPVGARMGYMKYKSWPIPTRSGIEFGSRPGIGSGVYFALKLDIAIGFMPGKTAASSGEKK